MDDVIQQVSKLMDQVIEGDILKKSATIYANMISEMELQGFTREEAVTIISRQGGFKLNG